MFDQLPKFTINGDPEGELSPLDRGFNYADGLFETVRLEGGKLPLWHWHRQRLEHSCERLGMALPYAQLRLWLTAVLADAAHMGLARGLVKITVTRGVGGRGYRYDSDATPTIVIGLYPPTNYPQQNFDTGVALFRCQQPLGINPSLAGLKNLNKLEYVLARAEWQGAEYAEGLLCDIEGRAVEGTVSNHFALVGRELLTPALHRCGVSGVMRRVVIEALAPQLELTVRECDLVPEQLLEADELFISNSVFGLWSVVQLGEEPIGNGPVTRQLQQKLGDFINQQLNKKEDFR